MCNQCIKGELKGKIVENTPFSLFSFICMFGVFCCCQIVYYVRLCNYGVRLRANKDISDT